MTLFGSLFYRVPETKPYISKHRYKPVKNHNCIYTADSFDFEVVVAETTNTIDFHRSSQMRSVLFGRSGSTYPAMSRKESPLEITVPTGTSGFRSGSTVLTCQQNLQIRKLT